MKLVQGLGLRGGETVAFVGAGGKTSAMFMLANELTPPVLLTTTTHLGDWQANLADQHLIITSPDVLQRINISEADTVLLTGSPDEGDRLHGLDGPALHAIQEHCAAHGLSLLIEADGARQLPLKAPADYEPVIPTWVDHVVIMAGLAGLENPLNAETVHRHELFGELAAIQPGDDIKVEHLSAVLGSAVGGLKGISEEATKILFLNQAEGEVRMSQGARLARELDAVYDRVLIGSLKYPGQDGPIFSVHSQTAGIILAAGGSERLGQPKQLLDWGGKPFVVQVAQNALTAGLAPIIVVTGSDHTHVADALNHLSVNCVFNPKWTEGQSTSMQVGLDALPQHCDRVMFLLSDQPQISPLLIRQLVERHNDQRAPITAPIVGGRRGNPVLFGRETFDTLKMIRGDQGGRAVFNQFKVDYLTWIDRRDAMDVDQIGDIDTLKSAFFDQV